MLQFTETKGNFRIAYKNYPFFYFSEENPIFSVGNALDKIRMFYGEYKIREKIKERITLNRYELLSQSPKRLVFKFLNESVSLIVKFEIHKDKLIIEPTGQNGEFNRFWVRIRANVDEAVYGCGAQYEDLNLRDKKIINWVQEEMLGEKSYFRQPTFLSSEQYFCHVDSPAYSEFNFKNDKYHELYIWEIPPRIIIGKYESLLSVVQNIASYFGIQPPLPDWVYDGIVLGIQGGKNVVNKKLERAKNNDLKVVGVWCQDWVGYLQTEFGKLVFYNWEYDKALYPDLLSYINSLNEKGIKFLGYINPFLNTDGNLYHEASKKNYIVKDEGGNDYFIKMGAFSPALLDITNPKTVKWIKSIIKENIINLGLDGWMTDYGEYLPPDAELFSGEDPKKYHNRYIVEWARIVYECLEESGKLNKILTFNRAGFSYFSKYVMLYWPGDQIVNWDPIEGLPTVITSGISCGLTGIGNYHFDIGGFSAHGEIKRSKELFMRWAEIACFSMMMRTHEGNKPDTNWQFDSDKETIQHLSKMVKIHTRLKPYLKELEKEYQLKGIPPMRACFLHYENDSKLQDLKHQYLLGRDLLIAPVLSPKKDKWKLYLPHDKWIHLWTSNKYKGGWIEVNSPMGKPPIFYLENSNFKELFKSLINME